MRVRAFLFLLLAAGTVGAEDKILTVAVASNFGLPFAEIAVGFHTETGIALRTIPASTGKLYAQITNGAPFDVFLAADVERPELLEQNGLAVSGSRFTYARGRLVLWSGKFDDCEAALKSGGRVAIANPKTAPFGRAAREYLHNAGHLDELGERLAYGDNVAQAFMFAMSGNADVGIVSPSLLASPHAKAGQCVWPVPARLHAPIEQQAVLLGRAADKESARRLLVYLQSGPARDIMHRYGYETDQ